TLMRGCPGSVPTSSVTSPVTLATASWSAGSTPARSTAQVTARYIAPVSRYAPSSAAASRRDTVDFPEPEGPSTATTQRCATRNPPVPTTLTPLTCPARRRSQRSPVDGPPGATRYRHTRRLPAKRTYRARPKQPDTSEEEHDQ